MIKDLVQKNRSYRGYDESRKVTREELVHLVECARLAPSSVNMQPLRYYLIHTQEELDLLQPLTNWARALPELTLPHPGHCPTGFVVICQDTNLNPSIPRFQKDIGIVAQTMLLAAVEMGLGGCMIGNYDAGKVKAALNLAENLAPVLIVAIGKPDETIVLTDVGPNGETNYYRDENDVHYVPKRSLDDLIINR
ncbi:nitroreductase family protein [Christensenella sp. MSJ-20]|uniref:nitroreductase family protein n=1 Tax=Christensenella sp. MSJ-20 TaxID=2841518 RepID=UPI000D7A097B|nr:MAG: nitroreductase [Bacillota bacterium]QWT55968.1 nitroreductase family protein [Christensenella sp. MSJ-20]